jgi:hypothetical protein
MPRVLSLLNPTSSEKVALVLHDYPEEKEEKLWREFLKRIDSTALYNAPEYFLESHCPGKRPFAVLAIDRGCIIGVLTGLHGKGEVACGVPSRPHIQVDPKAAPEATDLLINGILEEAQDEALITVFPCGNAPLPAFEQRGFHCGGTVVPVYRYRPRPQAIGPARVRHAQKTRARGHRGTNLTGLSKRASPKSINAQSKPPLPAIAANIEPGVTSSEQPTKSRLRLAS